VSHEIARVLSQRRAGTATIGIAELNSAAQQLGGLDKL
jgi:hypothetical protein